jgi:uncharacterized membrane protein
VRFGLWDDMNWSGRANSVRRPALALMVVSWLVAWVPVGATIYFGVLRESISRPIINGLIVGLAYATLLSYPLDAFSWFDARSSNPTWLSVWPLLSAIASLGGVVAAFSIRNRGLMALCIIAAVLHVSHFYYQMDTSLLIKSVIMMALGVAFLGGARRWR